MTDSEMQGRDPISVSEAVGRAKGAVGGLGQILVMGEVSGFRGPNARSGHVYCQLKDEVSTLSLTVWRGVYAASGVELRDGMQVQALGSFDVYPPSGKLSFVARRIFLAGEGLLRQQVAALAKRLEAEGLMDSSRKREVPKFCERVCVVTSLSGSVIEDVKRTLARRNPLVAIDVVGCSVQGADAPPTIIRALKVAEAARPDAILLVRGGGSFEDLMCFNDEGVARAIAACAVPVVTGIGHEPDTSIADMVADRRCSTPTAAAESVAPAKDQLAQLLDQRSQRLAMAMGRHVREWRSATDSLVVRGNAAMGNRLVNLRQHVEALAAHGVLQSPYAIVEGRRTSLELSTQRLLDAMPRSLSQRSQGVTLLAHRLAVAGKRPAEAARQQGERLAERLGAAGPRPVAAARQHVDWLTATLEALSPYAVLGRGYAIVRTAQGHVVADSARLAVGERVSVTLGNGSFDATVSGIDSTDNTSHE